MNESNSHCKSSVRFLFIQHLQEEKSEPVWRSQESEDCTFCTVLLSHTVDNQIANIFGTEKSHPTYNVLTTWEISLTVPGLSNVDIYTWRNYFSSTDQNKILFLKRCNLEWHWHQATPVSLECDAQLNSIFHSYIVEEVTIWLPILTTKKLCTANTCGRGKEGISQLFLCMTQKSRIHKRTKSMQTTQNEGQTLKDNSSALKHNYKCLCMSQYFSANTTQCLTYRVLKEGLNARLSWAWLCPDLSSSLMKRKPKEKPLWN